MASEGYVGAVYGSMGVGNEPWWLGYKPATVQIAISIRRAVVVNDDVGVLDISPASVEMHYNGPFRFKGVLNLNVSPTRNHCWIAHMTCWSASEDDTKPATVQIAISIRRAVVVNDDVGVLDISSTAVKDRGRGIPATGRNRNGMRLGSLIITSGPSEQQQVSKTTLPREKAAHFATFVP
ncbi:hypothetical protein K488DRAFT_75308 [Vararia minispora EC-137]|uniref:Uncharacterized protein n=1 Tax=Vararia minispora EC-137 TaxID=1314806 RepID=A0ACB8Q4V1_9AGAM|nr:hypothetical protein K488DRAFT_75308 [Vararia minispora EC-137]